MRPSFAKKFALVATLGLLAWPATPAELRVRELKNCVVYEFREYFRHPNAKVATKFNKDYELIANDPSMAALFEDGSIPYGKEARELASRMTWGQAFAIADGKYGDIYDQITVPINRGMGIHSLALSACPHCCLGCVVKAGEGIYVRPQLTWDAFRDTIKGLVGLERRIAKVTERRPFHLINAKRMIQFYDSEPMSVVLKDAAGNRYNVRDVMRFIHETVGTPSEIVTSGWNPAAPHSQKAAEELVADMLAVRADYVRKPYEDNFLFQVKVPSARFRADVSRSMTEILEKDASFQSRFKDDFTRYGLQFHAYKESEEAFAAYRNLARDHLEQIVLASSYMQERIANLRTLFPLFRNRKAHCHFSFAKADKVPHEMRYLIPFMDEPGVARLKELLLDRPLAPEFGKDNVAAIKVRTNAAWDFEAAATGPPSYRGYAILRSDGTVEFSGTKPGHLSTVPPLNMATDPDPHVRSLADNPLLNPDSSAPLREVAKRRLTGRWPENRDVTEPVLRSVLDRVQEVLIDGGVLPEFTTVRIQKRVRYVEPPSDKQPAARAVALLDLEVDQRKFVYRFNDDQLLNADMTPVTLP